MFNYGHLVKITQTQRTGLRPGMLGVVVDKHSYYSNIAVNFFPFYGSGAVQNVNSCRFLDKEELIDLTALDKAVCAGDERFLPARS